MEEIKTISKDGLNLIYQDIVKKFDVPYLQEHNGAFIFESDKKNTLTVNSVVEIDVKLRGSHESGYIWVGELKLTGWIDGSEISLNIKDSDYEVFYQKVYSFLEEHFKHEPLDIKRY